MNIHKNAFRFHIYVVCGDIVHLMLSIVRTTETLISLSVTRNILESKRGLTKSKVNIVLHAW